MPLRVSAGRKEFRVGTRATSRWAAWRVAALLGVFAVFAWGMAASIYYGSAGASAESNPRFRDVETILMVPQDGEWYHVKIGFFMFDDGTGSFDDAVTTARDEMMSNFPGSFEVAPGSVSAAYVASGFKWMSGSADWAYNADGEPASVAGAAHQAMNSAAASWGQQGANFQFTGGGTSGAGTGACGGGTDGANTVGWDAQSGSVLAVTCSWFSSQGTPFKSAVEFDMEFDPDWNWTTGSPTSVDLESVALHEFGHALGLNHSSDGGAVMFASYSSGNQKRTPTPDDVEGLFAVYGGPGGGGGEPTETPTETPTQAPTNTPTPVPSEPPTNTPTPPAGGGGGAPPPPTNTPVPTTPPGQGGGNSPTPSPTVPVGTTPIPTATPTKTPTPGVSPSPTPTKTPAAPPPSLPIVPGANLLAWPGNNLPPAQALAGLEKQIQIVYSWDPVSGTWQRYGPALPWYLNTMQTMTKGNAYWFIATGSGRIVFEE